MPRRFQFSLKTLFVDMGLLCFSLGALSWAHLMSGWNPPGDDLAVMVISGILAGIIAIPLRRRSAWPLSFFRTWCLFAALVCGVPCVSYHWTRLLIR